MMLSAEKITQLCWKAFGGVVLKTKIILYEKKIT